MLYLIYIIFMIAIANIQHLVFDDFNGAVISLFSAVIVVLYFILLEVKK